MAESVVVDHVVDPPPSEELTEQLVEIWRDVAHAGGAVGVARDADLDEVRALADAAFRRCAAGEAHMVVAFVGSEPVGLVFIEHRPGPLFRHWATVKRLQVHPSLQGRGIGAGLLRAVHDLARALGLEQLHLTVRGGTGTEGYYRRFGYEVVATIPGVIRVAEGDDRDEIYMVARLTGG